MIDISKVKIFGWEEAFRGMRNSWDSHTRADSSFENENVTLGPNDLYLSGRLCSAHPSHAKFRRMITVYCDILAPLYWWKEFDTYKVGTVANSQSTMHTITARPLTPDDFSHEHLLTLDDKDYSYVVPAAISVHGEECYYSPDYFITMICEMLNHFRGLYLETKDKRYWWQIIQLLPSSYNQTRTVMMNYEVLANIYQNRKDHKLDEWCTFCKWIEELPYSFELIM